MGKQTIMETGRHVGEQTNMKAGTLSIGSMPTHLKVSRDASTHAGEYAFGQAANK